MKFKVLLVGSPPPCQCLGGGRSTAGRQTQAEDDR